MEQLIKTSIKDLLRRICDGHHRHSAEDLAEGMQLTDEDVYVFILDTREDELEDLVGDDPSDFIEMIVDTLNSEWYAQVYQKHADRARQGIIDYRDWKETKEALRYV